MNTKASFCGAALLIGSLWFALQIIRNHESESPRALTIERSISFGHRAAAEALVALQFLSSLAKAWSSSAEYSANTLKIEKIEALLLNKAGFQSYANLAISYLALEAGDFENAIKLAQIQRSTCAPNSAEYFQSSMILAFVHHYFSFDFRQAGQIYLELAEHYTKMTWLKSLGQKLLAMQGKEKVPFNEKNLLPDLPAGVRAQICKKLLHPGRKSKMEHMLGPCGVSKTTELNTDSRESHK